MKPPLESTAVYCRISRDTEGLGLGVARQEAACRELAEARNLSIVQVFADNDVSATRGKRRPGFEALLDAATAGQFSTIVAWHVDRITRNPRELERLIDVLEKANVTVLTVTAGALDLSTASGRMQARVVGAVARHESEQKSERLRAKAGQLAAAGKVGGGGWRPYGFEADRVTIRESEAVNIRSAAADVLAGRAIRSIVRSWDAAGITTTTGARWTPFSLRRTLLSARVAGLREHHGDVVADAVWPAIVDRGTWEAVCRILRDPSRRMNQSATKYLLTGIAYCGLCDKRLIARPRGDRRRCYVCASGPGLHGCGKIRILADPLEELIAGDVLIALERVDLSEPPVINTKIGLEIADIEHRLADLADDFASGLITRAEWLRARTGLQERLDAARVTLANQTARPAAVTGDIGERWTDLDLLQRRAVLDAVVDRVVVGPAVRGRNKFDATRITIVWKV